MVYEGKQKLYFLWSGFTSAWSRPALAWQGWRDPGSTQYSMQGQHVDFIADALLVTIEIPALIKLWSHSI